MTNMMPFESMSLRVTDVSTLLIGRPESIFFGNTFLSAEDITLFLNN